MPIQARGLLPQGVLFVVSDIDAAHETDFNRWYDREHVAERVNIPGFTSGSRYIKTEGAGRYLGLYFTENLAVFESPAYQAAFEHQTAWSVDNLGRMKNPRRRVCRVSAHIGRGLGTALAVLTLPAEWPVAGLSSSAEAVGTSLSTLDGFVHSCLLQPDTRLSSPLPTESTQGRLMQSMHLLEATSPAALRFLADRAQAAWTQYFSGAIEPSIDIYQLGWSLNSN